MGTLRYFATALCSNSRSAHKRDPISHQIIANADGSVLAASEDGLVGLRQGKVQRMTMRKRPALQRHYFLHRGQGETLVALHGLRHQSSWQIPSYSDGGPIRKRSCRPASMTNSTESLPGRPSFQFGGALSRMGAYGLPAEFSCRWWIRPEFCNKLCRRRPTSNRSPLTERNSQQPITLSSRRTPMTCRLITLRPRF